MIFQHQEPLWALVAALTLVGVWRVFRRRPYAAFPLAALLTPQVYRASRLRRVPTLVAAAALPMIALALTDPIVPFSEGEVKSRGLDVIMVVDLSSSMQQSMGGEWSVAKGAYLGDTRMEVTKKALIDFIALRPDDRIGLIVFSEYAYLVSPLTFDHAYLRDYVMMIDEQTLRNEGMTAIGEGMALASALLARQSGTRSAGQTLMIVFTDGEHNIGMHPLEALELADRAGTRVHLVGIDLDEAVKTRPEVLRLIDAVRRYGGRYFNADTAYELQKASLTIDALEKGWLQQTRYTRNQPVYEYFAIPAILLLTAALLLRAVPYFIDVT